MPRDLMVRLVRSGLLTGVIDGLFSSILNVMAYRSTVSRLFQGVAGVLLGKEAFDGGMPTVVLGVFMHFGVAFGWAAVFLCSSECPSWPRAAAYQVEDRGLRVPRRRQGIITCALVRQGTRWTIEALRNEEAS